MNKGFAHGKRAGAVLLLAVLAALSFAVAFSFVEPPSPGPQFGAGAGTSTDARLPVAEGGGAEASSGRLVTYEPDHVLVRFEPSASLEEVRESLSQAGSVDSSDVTEEDVELGFARLALSPGYDVEDALTETSPLAYVLSSQPNFVYGLAETAADPTSILEAAGSFPQLAEIDDPRATEQWHLGESGGINAYAAWDLARSGDQVDPVTVAILDTGCDISHEDLADNVVATYDATARSWFDFGGSMRDSSGHGTHVCGLVSAVTGNGIGVSGVSYNARLLPVRVFKGSETDSATLLRAYRYVMTVADDYNVRVVNMSLGGELEKYDEADQALIDTVEEAFQAGILTVCAAGNGVVDDEPYVMFPADYLEHAMGVIALEKGGRRASFSNFNISDEQRTKDISAPGTEILSTWLESQYRNDSGTSMASPIVAGVAALVFSADPSLSPSQVIDMIHATAADLGEAGFDKQTGYGRVDAYAAVKQALTSLEGAETVAVGASIELSPTTDGSWAWQSDDESVARVHDGVVTGVSEGSAVITVIDGTVTASKAVVVYEPSPAARQPSVRRPEPSPPASGEGEGLKDEEGDDSPTDSVSEADDDQDRQDVIPSKPVADEVAQSLPAPAAVQAPHGSTQLSESKKAQKITVKTKVATVKAAKLKKKRMQLTCVAKVKGAYGKLTFKLMGGSNRLSVNGKTGKVTVKKNTRKGTYKVRVKVVAGATGAYKKSNAVLKTFTVKVTGS